MSGVTFIGYWLPADKRVIVCRHVLESAPAALIAHHRDGDIQILCERPYHQKSDAGAVDLGHLLFAIPELARTPEIRPGEWAQKDDFGGWRVSFNPED